MYSILIKKQAQKTLQSLSRAERVRITEKIVLLGKDPDHPLLDVKKLENQPFFRLRVGSWRVLFVCEEAIKVMSIEKIKPRGDVYK